MEKHHRAGKLSLKQPPHFNYVISASFRIIGCHHAVTVAYRWYQVGIFYEMTSLKIDQVGFVSHGIFAGIRSRVAWFLVAAKIIVVPLYILYGILVRFV